MCLPGDRQCAARGGRWEGFWSEECEAACEFEVSRAPGLPDGPSRQRHLRLPGQDGSRLHAETRANRQTASRLQAAAVAPPPRSPSPFMGEGARLRGGRSRRREFWTGPVCRRAPAPGAPAPGALRPGTCANLAGRPRAHQSANGAVGLRPDSKTELVLCEALMQAAAALEAAPRQNQTMGDRRLSQWCSALCLLNRLRTATLHRLRRLLAES